MGKRIFLFDLDATVTREEILPRLAKELGRYDEMRALTERTMRGELPFCESFARRVEMLRPLPLETARRIAAQTPLHEQVAGFLRARRERCWIVTGNLDAWIPDLLLRLGMEGRCFCSKARIENGAVAGVAKPLEKAEVLRRFSGERVVAVGDGDNDAELIAGAEIGIGFGGVRQVAESVRRNAAYLAESEEALCAYLYALSEASDGSVK